uniref:Uncharacterized protein n=1 Tax=Arundo donax TaxID=35708 RepID=A0A0A8XPI1_ARUDO
MFSVAKCGREPSSPNIAHASGLPIGGIEKIEDLKDPVAVFFNSSDILN